jgi:hypothetical protein
LFVNTNGQPDFSGWTILAIGLAQWWALGTRIKGKRRWALIVVASLFVLNTVFNLLGAGATQLDTLLQHGQDWVASTQPVAEPFVAELRDIFLWIATGVIAGFTIGAVQWLRLRLYVNKASWWIWANIIGWTSSTLILWATSAPWLSNLVLGGLTGLGLVVLLWHTRGNTLLLPRRSQWNMTGILAYSGLVLAILANFIIVNVSPPGNASTPSPDVATIVPSLSAEVATATVQPGANIQMRVDTDGRNALVRESPGTAYTVLTRLSDGTIVTFLGETVEADGITWQRIRSGTNEGWIWKELLVDINE